VPSAYINRDKPPSETWLNFRAAALLGLISSTFSTIATTLAAARIGQDPITDWMVVAAIPFRDGMLQIERPGGSLRPGSLFINGRIFPGRWSSSACSAVGPRLAPLPILMIGLSWAMLTSAIEWAFLVPAFPFWQPIFTLRQPYWVGFIVHATSA